MIDEKLLDALHRGQCIISYEKIEGSDVGQTRDMLCTLDPSIIPSHTGVKQSFKSDHLLVWCIDRDNWRSIRTSTIKEWKSI